VCVSARVNISIIRTSTFYPLSSWYGLLTFPTSQVGREPYTTLSEHIIYCPCFKIKNLNFKKCDVSQTGCLRLRVKCRRRAGWGHRVKAPKVVAAWLAFLLGIGEVPGSNLDPQTAYPDWKFVFFLSSSRQMSEQYIKICNDRFLPYPFQFTIHPIIRRYIVWASESAVK
jgi:hypothetical protein